MRASAAVKRQEILACCWFRRSAPSGFWPQSSTTRCASASPSSLRFWGRGGWGRRKRAPSSPCSRKRLQTRSTELLLTENASMICEVDQPRPKGLRSTLSRTWAWVMVQAELLPRLITCSKLRRCAAVNKMLSFFMGNSLCFQQGLFADKHTPVSPFRQLKLDKGVYEFVVGKQGKKEYPHLAKKPSTREETHEWKRMSRYEGY